MHCIFEISNDILIIKNTLTLSTIANDEINQVHEPFKYFRRSGLLMFAQPFVCTVFLRFLMIY